MECGSTGAAARRSAARARGVCAPCGEPPPPSAPPTAAPCAAGGYGPPHASIGGVAPPPDACLRRHKIAMFIVFGLPVTHLIQSMLCSLIDREDTRMTST